MRSSPEEILATTRYAQLVSEASDEPVSGEQLREAARALGTGTSSRGGAS